MEYGAIDLHKKESQVRIITESGEVIDRRIPTTRPKLASLFWGRGRTRILLEASTESEWVAQYLETLGHEVIVADPNYTPMYGHRTRRIKTDQRDVAALTEACQQGFYRPAHRRSARQRDVHMLLNVRGEFVQARTRAIALARAITRAEGLRVPGCSAETFSTRLGAFELPGIIRERLAPLRTVLDLLDDEVEHADAEVGRVVADDPVCQRLMTLPGVGPMTASAYMAALDDVRRFARAGQVTSYLGLVPREYRSGERQRRGGVLRSANPYVQSLLIQAAWRIWRSSDRRTASLREWAQHIARRRGKQIAVVALARRLARILYAMWRDQANYEAKRVQPHQSKPTSTCEVRPAGSV